MPSGMGYGAAVGLEQVLARLFEEQQAKQRAAEAAAQLDLQNRTLAQRAKEFDLSQAADESQFGRKLGQDQSQFDATQGQQRQFHGDEMTLQGRRLDQDASQFDRTYGQNERNASVNFALQGARIGQDSAEAAANREAAARENAANRASSERIAGMRIDAAAAKPEGPSAYTAERAKRTVDSVDALMGKVGAMTAGLGSLTAAIPGTPATDFASELDTLKSNIIASELTQMREASKTGGALGQISDRESQFLSAALGALNARQSPANLRAQLQKVKDSILRWQNANGLAQGGSGGGVSIDAARAGMGAAPAPSGAAHYFDFEKGTAR